ncbi:hypothetical protein, partial [Pseudomonas aeruginosa]|uniref:hypothetical protein n=2 Tax=Pseudomonas aeruginosa TaxID=287 RepID=UPI001955EF1E
RKTQPTVRDGLTTTAYRKPGELRAGGQLMEPMPYQEIFWRSSNLTSVKTFPPPNGVSGFITALPTSWTRGERNDSGLNLSDVPPVLSSAAIWSP